MTAILLLFTSGMARAIGAITYTYSDTQTSCKTLTIAPSGAITCNTVGTNATPFRFDDPLPLSCKAGLDINTSTGLVKCATMLPECTLLRATASGTAVLNPGEAVKAKPGETVTLTATCDQGAAHYHWASTQTSTSAASTSPIPESDPQTAKVIIPDTMPAGYHSYTVMASKSADFGYGASASAIVKVVVPGQSGPYAYIPGTSGSVSVIDTASNATLTASQINVGVGSAPVGVAVHPSGTRAYVTGSGLNKVSVIDTASNKELGTVSVAPEGTGPEGIAITPDGNIIFVANKTSHNVSVIEAANLIATPKVRTVGKSPVGVAISPDGKKVYVANSGSKNVSVINVDGYPDGGAIGTDAGPFGVAVTADGKKIYVSNSIDNTVTEIKVSDTGGYSSAGFPLGEGANKPLGIAVKPADKGVDTEVYVANHDSSTISVISTADNQTAENKIIATLKGINSPYGVAFNQTGSLAYVTNTNDKTVSIIDTLTKEVVDKISVVGNPYALGQFVGPASPYRGLWYNKLESGWGMSIIQHGNISYVIIYTYDHTGQPVWYVMSNCHFDTARSCTGAIYKVVGGKPPTAAWVALDFTQALSTVGSGTLTFSDASNGRFDNGKFDFTLNGVGGSKTIERQRFHNETAAGDLDYTDLWWNEESGWGVVLAQDKGMIFAAWYTYNDSGKPVWYVASACPLAGNGCTGELYSVTGGTELAAIWNAGQLPTTRVGSVTFAFSSDGSAGTMRYDISGVQKSKDIARQPFPF